MRIIKEEKKQKVSVLKKYVLPEGREIKLGKYVLEAKDELFFKVKEEDNSENFGGKQAKPFTADDAEEARAKKEEDTSMDSDEQNVEDDDTGIQEKCGAKKEEVGNEVEDNDEDENEEVKEETEIEDKEDAEEKKPADKVEEAKKRMKKVAISENGSGSKKNSLFSGLTEGNKWK